MLRWLMVFLGFAALGCTSWSVRNRTDADLCMQRCLDVSGHGKPEVEVHSSAPGRSLPPRDTCVQRCSHLGGRLDEPAPEAEEPFRPNRDED